MTTENADPLGELDTTLAAERLCMALLKLEKDTPGGLAALQSGLQLPVLLADAQTPDLGSVWRRLADLAESVRRDLEWVSNAHG